MKKKKQNKKRSAFGTILLVLLSLAFAGFIWNIVNDSVKDEEPIVEDEKEPEVELYELTLTCSEHGAVYVVKYKEGMTWGEWVESDYNNIGFTYNRNNSTIVTGEYACVLSIYDEEHGGRLVDPSELIDNTLVFDFML